MNAAHQAWQKLVTAARAAPAPADESAPFGFSTRLAGLAFAGPAASPWALFEKFAVRGLIAACAFGIAAVAFGYSAWSSDRDTDNTADEGVAEVLDLS